MGKAANVLIFGAEVVKALILKEIRGKAWQNAQTFPCTLSLLKELHPSAVSTHRNDIFAQLLKQKLLLLFCPCLFSRHSLVFLNTELVTS